MEIYNIILRMHMHILDFLKGRKPEKRDEDVITCEYRLLCSGEIYNGDVETFDWRKSTACRLLLTSPFTVFVASEPLYGTIPQELALRFTTQMVTEERESTIKSISMFYPDEEIAKDIAALLSVFCRRLITICAKVREIHPNQPDVIRDWPVDFVNSLKTISWKHHPATSVLFPNGTIKVIDYNPPQKALSSEKLRKLFLALPNLPCAESIIRSVRLYAIALERIYQDADMAYQLLISSVETIANAVYRSYTATEADMIKTKSNVADLAVEFGLSEEKSNRLAVEACKGISWTKQKFSKFLLENVSDALWTADDLFKLPPQFLPNKNDFKATIDEIYDARSKASHSGGAFPASASIVTGPMLPTKVLFEFDGTQRPFPPVSWFERVVNTAIQNFIESAIDQDNSV